MPVKTIARPFSSAASITSLSRIEPPGWMRDKEVIEAADEKGLAMVFTGMRHFRH